MARLTRPIHTALRRAGLFTVALVLVAVIRATLSIAGHRRILRWMPRAAARTAHPAMALRIARAVSTAARVVPGATCLPQALAAQLMLALRDCASEVAIGVRRDEEGKFCAHAWLLSGGHCVLGGSDAELASFVPLTELAVRRS